jgi:hypothetical protein
MATLPFLSPATTDKSNKTASVKKWLGEIDAARKREKDWRKEGQRIKEIFDGKKKDSATFNILYSNTETLVPSLYSQVPRPVVKRRFADADPLGKAASQAAERMLKFLCDTNSEAYEDYDSSMQDVVLDAALPGRGMLQFCYEADTVPGDKPGDPEQICSDCIYSESIHWKRVIFGFAKKWCDVPWVAFELYYDKTEATKAFGPKIADTMTYVPENQEDDDNSNDQSGRKSTDDEDAKSLRQVACVYKIWDKRGRRVLFVSQNYDEVLKQEDDPYELTGFYPFPQPLRLLPKSNDLLPVALYLLYENQAKELNKITTRLNRLIDACKVRGVYDSSLDEIEELLKKDDNTLIGAKSVSVLQRDGGLDKHIWLMPIEKIITVIQQLYVARQQCKSVIYEITGISDIMRGSSVASETLGAQEIKTQWGTVRLKKMQKAVQKYARDSFRIMLEMAVNMLELETWIRATGLPFMTPSQVQQAQAAQAAAMQQYAMAVQQHSIISAQAQAAGTPPPAPPQPPVPPQLPPAWTDVIGLLKDQLQREYHVDIETNSTVLPDATEDKQNMTEMLNAVGQFLNAVTPLVMEGSLPFEAAQGILLGIVRKFEMGTEIEDYIRSMKPPQPKAPDKSGEVKLQGQLQQAGLENAGLKQQNEFQKKEHDLGLREAQLKTDRAALTADQELHRIQKDSSVKQLGDAHEKEQMRTKQIADGALGKAEKIATQISAKLDADAKARQAEREKQDGIQKERDKAASQTGDLAAMLKDLKTAIDGLAASNLADSVPDRDQKTGKIARVRKVVKEKS